MPMTGNFDATTNEGWFNELAVQLRLRGATGAEVGQALAEAESHLADSGEPASLAFGTPQEYATTLLPQSRRAGVRAWVNGAFVGGWGYLGASMLLGAALSGGEGVPLTMGAVVAMGVLSGMSAIVTLASGYLFQRVGFVVALLAAGAVGVVAPGVALRTPLATIPAASAAIIGVMFLAGAIQSLFKITKGDPVVDPRNPAGILNDAELQLARAGRQLDAIKAHRVRTGATLAQAKKTVEDARG